MSWGSSDLLAEPEGEAAFDAIGYGGAGWIRLRCKDPDQDPIHAKDEGG